MADGRIEIDTRINTDGAEQGLRGLGGKLNGLAQAAGKGMKRMAIGAGAAITAMGGIGMKYNSDMEGYMAGFTTLMGSADKASKHIAELKKYASATPFEMSDLAKASTTLQSFGFKGKEVMPILQKLGDVSLGNKEKFNSLSLVFGQVKSQGKLMGQDLMQMINAGFNPLQIISQKTGKSMAQLKDEMSKGKITYEDVAKATQWATEEGGMFYKGMEKQSTTFSGLFSTLKDNISEISGKIMKPFFDMAKNAMINLLPVLDNVSKALDVMFQKINEGKSVGQSFRESFKGLIPEETLNNIANFVDGVIFFLQGMVEYIKGDVDKARESFYAMFPTDDIGNEVFVDIIMGVLDSIKNLFNFITENKGLIIDSVIAIGIVFEAWKIGAIISKIVQGFQQAQVALALYQTTAEGATISQGVLNGVFSAWEVIVALLTGKITLATVATAAWAKVTGVLNAMWAANPIGVVVLAIIAVVTAIVLLWRNCEGFRNAVIAIWNNIKVTAVAVWYWLVYLFTVEIPNAFQSVVDFFKSIPERAIALWETIKQAFATGWQAIVDFFTVTIPQWIEQIFQWFNELPYKIGYALGFALTTIVMWGIGVCNYLVTNVPIWINNVVQWFASLPGRIWAWLSDVISRISAWGQQTYTNMVQGATNAINGAIQWFSQLPGRIWTWLSNTISKMIEFGSSLGSKATEAGSKMSGNIIDAVKNLPSKFMDVGINIVKGVWEGIVGMGSWIGDKVSGFFKGVLQGAKDANKIKSPSRLYRDEVGKYMAQGIGVGFEDESENIKSQMAKNLSTITGKMQATVGMETAKFNMGISARNNKNTGSSNEITNNNDNGLTLNIENFVNNTKQDIKTISQELEFYRKRNSLIGGV